MEDMEAETMRYNDYRQVAERNFESLQNARQEFRTNSAASHIDSLMDRVVVTEYMVQAMWTLLMKTGATREDLFEELNKVIAKNKNVQNKRPKYSCPKCGKIMQMGNFDPFTANCMYCGSTRTIYPYDTVEDLEAMGADGIIKPESDVVKDPLDDLGF